MSEPVIYELGLKDNFTKVIHGAEASAQKFEGSLEHVKGIAAEVGAALVAAFGIYQIEAFIRSSDEVFEHLKLSNAQVQAGLESTHYQAGVTYDDLQESQKKFRSQVDYSRASLADMQALILTFPGITKTTFDQASQAVLDMSTRLHHGLDETAIMVGKALQDPTHGITALRRVGVNFNETQTEMVKHMVATNHMAEAQSFILNELNNEFAGSAVAARQATPLADYKQNVEDLQLTIGELTEEIKSALAPTLISIVKEFKEWAEWIGRNKDEIGTVIKVIAEAIVVYKGLSFVVGLMQAIALATAEASVATGAEAAEAIVATTATEGFAGAMTTLQASLGPIIISLTAIVGLYQTLKEGMITVEDMQNNMTPEMKENIKKQSKLDVDYESQRLAYQDIFPDDKDKRDQLAVTNTKSDYQEQLKKAQEVIKTFKDLEDSGDILTAPQLNHNKHYQDAIAQVTVLTEKIKALDQMQADKENLKQGKIISAASASSATATDKGTKATGSKNINIKIDIKELVHEFRLSTTNIQEGASKAKDMVAAALISAVNDSQIIAGE